MAGIPKNLSDAAVAFEASIAMLNTDPSLREHGIGLFLLLGEFVFGLTLLFPLPFEWDDNLCLADRESLETTVCTHLKFRCTGEACFINNLLVMYRTWCFLTHSQNTLSFGMGDGDMFARMALLLARIVLLLLFVIFGTAGVAPSRR